MQRPKLRDVAKGLGIEVGCIDNSCIWGSPGGMGTNGGCRCIKVRNVIELRMELLRMTRVAQHLLESVPKDVQRECEHCGLWTRITTAGCDHCDLEDK